MKPSDKIEITIRAAQIAKIILGLLESNSRFHAKLTVIEAAKMLKELDDKITSLPKELPK